MTRRGAACLAIAAAAACGHTTVTTIGDADAVAAASEALDIWAEHGVHLEHGDDGPIWIVVGEVGRPGELVDRGACTRWIVASRSPMIIAHEIGHALGLQHADAGLMAEAGPVSVELDDEQVESAAAAADRLAACVVGP
jgi:hypothetical protein